MEITRKGFISSLGATIVTAVSLRPDLALAVTPEPQEPSGVKSFRPLVGSVFFALTPTGQRVSMVLREVVERPGDPSIEQFSLVFAPGRQTAIPTGTYSVDHPSLGSFQLFLSAGGNRVLGKGELVRADFSLLKV